jgi:hypothetical protein
MSQAPESYHRFNANRAPFSYLVNYYDNNAIDRSSIIFTFPQSRLGIRILVHQRLPTPDFKRFLRDFFIIKAREDHIATANGEIEITVVSRPAREADDDDDANVLEESD